MNEFQPYLHNPFAQQIYDSVRKIDFGANFKIVPVTSSMIVEQLMGSQIKSFDYRAKTESEQGYVSVFEGLAFDPDNIRSQAVALYEGKEPVGFMTHIIAPKSWIQQQRYFEKKDEGIYIRDFGTIKGDGFPDFLVIPAMTKVDPKYLLRFAVPGFRSFQNAMSLIIEHAPTNTWIEVIAKGEFPLDQQNIFLKISEQGVGKFIPKENLPFDVDLIGKNTLGSSSSVKMAQLLGLRQIQNIGSAKHLGPVFAKKLR